MEDSEKIKTYSLTISKNGRHEHVGSGMTLQELNDKMRTYEGSCDRMFYSCD
jgi:hypothetical protein